MLRIILQFLMLNLCAICKVNKYQPPPVALERFLGRGGGQKIYNIGSF